jgi:hypothetical protein
MHEEKVCGAMLSERGKKAEPLAGKKPRARKRKKSCGFRNISIALQKSKRFDIYFLSIEALRLAEPL